VHHLNNYQTINIFHATGDNPRIDLYLFYEKIDFDNRIPSYSSRWFHGHYGIRVSAETRSKMAKIINGEVNADDLRQELVKRCSKPIE
tara:strand:- start:234074 stop:234337 length:264 start_codon:yes stop_codon:yes gene_type:complete